MYKFPYTRIQLKRISTFLFILLALLSFNLYFNLNYKWYGISLVVRIYLFVFSFYLIYFYASDDLVQISKDYTNKLWLIFETRVFPFLFIYFITIIFTLIDYSNQHDWPWYPFVSLLNGRYTNTTIYPLFLLFILKLRKRPLVTIPLFFIVAIIYFSIDRYVSNIIFAGNAIFAFKFIKLFLFSFFLFWDFAQTLLKKFLSFFVSILIGLSLYFIITGIYYLGYTFSSEKSYLKIETTLHLARFGSPVGIRKLKEVVLEKKNILLFLKLNKYAAYYNINIDYSDKELELLLLSDNIDSADKVAGFFLENKRKADYNKIIKFILLKTSKTNLDVNDIYNAKNIIKLTAYSIKGNEFELINLMKIKNKKFLVWGVYVLGESRVLDSIPFLLKYLNHVELGIAHSVYDTLVKITGRDPAENKKEGINSPEVIKIFKKYYLENKK